MKLGDFVKKMLAPFVEGTYLANCESCENRRIALNSLSSKISDFFSKITCPCFWRKLFNK